MRGHVSFLGVACCSWVGWNLLLHSIKWMWCNFNITINCEYYSKLTERYFLRLDCLIFAVPLDKKSLFNTISKARIQDSVLSCNQWMLYLATRRSSIVWRHIPSRSVLSPQTPLTRDPKSIILVLLSCISNEDGICGNWLLEAFKS
jgi:hypothetical protein